MNRDELLAPERIDSVIGSHWVIRRVTDGHIEYGGFASLDEAEQFLIDGTPA